MARSGKSSDFRLSVLKSQKMVQHFMAMRRKVVITIFHLSLILVIAYATSQMPGNGFTNGTEIDESVMGMLKKIFCKL